MPEYALAITGWVAALVFAGAFIIHGFAGRPAAADQSAPPPQTDLYRRIFETSLDLLLVTDRKGLLVDISPSSKDILGYEPGEMTGHIGIDFIHPDDLPPISGWVSPFDVVANRLGAVAEPRSLPVLCSS